MLEKMGYIKEGNVFIKKIGEYQITVFLTDKTNFFIRRILKGDTVIDFKKIQGIQSLERDEVFANIIAAQPFTKIVVNDLCGAEKEALLQHELKVVAEEEPLQEVKING